MGRQRPFLIRRNTNHQLQLHQTKHKINEVDTIDNLLCEYEHESAGGIVVKLHDQLVASVCNDEKRFNEFINKANKMDKLDVFRGFDNILTNFLELTGELSTLTWVPAKLDVHKIPIYAKFIIPIQKYLINDIQVFDHDKYWNSIWDKDVKCDLLTWFIEGIDK